VIPLEHSDLLLIDLPLELVVVAHAYVDLGAEPLLGLLIVVEVRVLCDLREPFLEPQAELSVIGLILGVELEGLGNGGLPELLDRGPGLRATMGGLLEILR
jgi:hypothetical protein